MLTFMTEDTGLGIFVQSVKQLNDQDTKLDLSFMATVCKLSMVPTSNSAILAMCQSGSK